MSIMRQRVPLILCVCGLILMIMVVYYYWPWLFFQAQQWQRSLHQTLTQLLISVQKDSQHAGLVLVGFSFLYGVLHSAGPGHGKIVITTYLATQPTHYRRALFITLSAALLQGVVAVGLVSVSLTVLHLSTQQLSLSEVWLEKSSYLVIIAVGLLLIWRARKHLQRPKIQPKQITLQPVRQNLRHIYQIKPLSMKITAEQCGCGHQHLPAADALSKANSGLTRLMMIIAIGIRPCSGAILVLIFAKILGVFSWGIIAVFMMSLGTALTISVIAMLVILSRQLANKLLQNSHRSNWLKHISLLVALLGGGLLVLFGLLLFMSVPTVNPLLL